MFTFRQSIQNEIHSKDIVIQYNEKGTMTVETFEIWLANCWPTNHSGSPKCLLIMDWIRVHINSKVRNNCEQAGAIMAVIPQGLSSKLQPLELSVNTPFRNHIVEQWNSWLATGQYPKPDCGQVCNWILQAWQKITPATIRVGFQKAHIVPALVDGNKKARGEEVCLPLS